MNQAKARNLPLSKRGMSFETVMWVFTRATALLMYGFILVGIVGALMMGAANDMNFADILRWALMPNVSHVENTNLADLAPWATTFWKLVAMGLFVTASSHGVHGVIVVLDDYFAKHSHRQIIRGICVIIFLAVAPAGLYVIWTS